MRLTHLFRLLAAIALSTTFGLAAHLIHLEWRAYDAVRRNTPLLALFRTTLVAAEAVSAERGPSNALLGAADSSAEKLPRSLGLARGRSDDAIAAAAEEVARSACARCSQGAARLREVRAQLDHARAEIDRLARLPIERRSPQEIGAAVHAMFEAVSGVMPVADAIMFELVQGDPQIAEHLSVARLAAELREHAGRAGSQLTPALTARRPPDEQERQRLWTEMGRVIGLGDLIGTRAQDHAADSEAIARALGGVKRVFFSEGMGYLAQVGASPAPGNRQPSAAEFAVLYVSKMQSIVELRDAELDLARSALAAQAGGARHALWLLSGVVVAVLVLSVLSVLAFARRVVRPLQQATDAVLQIAAGRYAVSVPGESDGQLGALMHALRELRQAMLDKAALEAGRDAMLERLEQAAEQEREQARMLLVARDEAEASSRAKGNFLATMSHEIRTPMHGLLGLVELVQRGELTPAQRHQLDVAAASGKALLQLLDDILDYSSISAGKMTSVLSTVDLRALIDDAVSSLSANAHGKGLRMEVRVDAAIAAAHLADSLRLRQILLNLISNAIKFTTQGHVGVTARLAGSEAGRQRIALTVHDTGAGIHPDMHEAMFMPFARATQAPERHVAGTGLGLAISKELAALLGGSLEWRSRQGAGSAFTLRVELEVATRHHDDRAAADQRVPAVREPAIDALAGAGSPRIVVAEDNPVNQFVLKEQLSQLGWHNVQVCDDGAQAWAALRASPADLLITDLFMPGMDGIELTRCVRSAEGAGAERVPVIAMTATTLPEDLARCRDAGVDVVLNKPTSIAALGQAIAQLLGG